MILVWAVTWSIWSLGQGWDQFYRLRRQEKKGDYREQQRPRWPSQRPERDMAYLTITKINVK